MKGLGGGILFLLPLLHIPVLAHCLFYILVRLNKKQNIFLNLPVVNGKVLMDLTEPNSGSDALGAKTTAKLSDDGKHYILNGQKCWITNGGFADVYTVFAKIDGDKFTAFIIERGMEGFTQGPEEHKDGYQRIFYCSIIFPGL